MCALLACKNCSLELNSKINIAQRDLNLLYIGWAYLCPSATFSAMTNTCTIFPGCKIIFVSMIEQRLLFTDSFWYSLPSGKKIKSFLFIILPNSCLDFIMFFYALRCFTFYLNFTFHLLL